MAYGDEREPFSFSDDQPEHTFRFNTSNGEIPCTAAYKLNGRDVVTEIHRVRNDYGGDIFFSYPPGDTTWIQRFVKGYGNWTTGATYYSQISANGQRFFEIDEHVLWQDQETGRLIPQQTIYRQLELFEMPADYQREAEVTYSTEP